MPDLNFSGTAFATLLRSTVWGPLALYETRVLPRRRSLDRCAASESSAAVSTVNLSFGETSKEFFSKMI
jgi:hypothetical protein